MNVLLDIGNTRIKWALGNDGALESGGEFTHAGAADSDWSAWADALPDGITAVYAASVAGDAVASRLNRVLAERYQLDVAYAVSEATRGGLTNGYVDVRQLGVDRWMAIVGACTNAELPVCVVDAGTAVTIDRVAADGQHEGGLIIPGLSLMQQALFADTGDIERFAAMPDGDAAGELGKGTAAAVRIGALHAVAGAVRETLSGKPVRLIVTGGDARYLLPLLDDLSPEHRPRLVLEGLLVVAGAQ